MNFLCAWVANISGISGKVGASICKVKYVFIIFYTPLIQQSIKNTKKTFLGLKDIIIFTIWVPRKFQESKT